MYVRTLINFLHIFLISIHFFLCPWTPVYKNTFIPTSHPFSSPSLLTIPTCQVLSTHPCLLVLWPPKFKQGLSVWRGFRTAHWSLLSSAMDTQLNYWQSLRQNLSVANGKSLFPGRPSTIPDWVWAGPALSTQCLAGTAVYESVVSIVELWELSLNHLTVWH